MLLTFIFIIVLFHLGWFALSRIITRRQPPDERAILAFHQAESELLDLASVRDIHEQTVLAACGGRLHLDILAHGQGRPTLVFVPGTSVYAQLYMEFLSAMHKDGFNVVAFDPLGHGRSSGPRGDYTFGAIVDQALAVCDYAKKRFGGRVAIAGSSQGGMAAFYAAAKDDSLAAAVCHNVADLNGRDNLILSRLVIPAALVPAARFLMRLYADFAFPTALYLNLKREYLPDGRDAAGFLKKDPLAVTWITFRALSSLMYTPLAKPVEKIRVPVMVVHSDKDHIFPQEYVENIYRRLGCEKEFFLLADREHLILTNNVDEVAPGVSAWLKKIMDTPD
ncbi:hypothetical protein JCM14469_38740 [Desulfatiferula olefinivorans]